ncbi:MAG: TIGR04283 family arsenosugar biosynthesis glycosyltransferase [Chromatiales bacterium]|nr:TIGR04283 family arsenosugar biosynthesis glycosyltransferase [Chromatiales bacterium]
MSLSIIIPALNESQSLRVLLPVLAGKAEVIVVDGGSSDESKSVASDNGVIFLESDRGRARQMNAGAAMATGENLLFLHADTTLPDNALALIDEAMAQGALWGRFNVRLSGSHWLLRIVERLMNLRSCTTGIATGDQGIFVKRDLFVQLGGYADIPLMEDVELSKRLRRFQWPFCIREALTTSSRRWEHYGIVRTIVLMWRMRLAYILGVRPEQLARAYRRSDSEGQGS